MNFRFGGVNPNGHNNEVPQMVLGGGDWMAIARITYNEPIHTGGASEDNVVVYTIASGMTREEAQRLEYETRTQREEAQTELRKGMAKITKIRAALGEDDAKMLGVARLQPKSVEVRIFRVPVSTKENSMFIYMQDPPKDEPKVDINVLPKF